MLHVYVSVPFLPCKPSKLHVLCIRCIIYLTPWLAIATHQVDIGLDMPSYQDYKYGVEYLFISLLAKSKFRTTVRH